MNIKLGIAHNESEWSKILNEPAYSIVRVSNDSDQKSFELMEQVLPEVGFNLIHIKDSEELLTFLDESSVGIALILIDHTPKSLDGFELRRKMMEDFSDLPVVIKTDIFLDKSEVDSILDLKISSVISEYETKLIKKIAESYNRVEDIEIECAIREVFVSESNELLEEVESSILELESHPNDMEALKKLFRAVHTIKGTCQVIRWREFEKYTHSYENILSKVIAGDLTINHIVSNILLKGYDQLYQMVIAISDNKRICFDLDHWLNEFDIKNNKKRVPSVESISDPALRDGQQPINSEGTRTIKVAIDDLSHLTHSVNLLTQYREQLNENIDILTTRNLKDEKKALKEALHEMSELEKTICETLEEVRCVPMKSVYRPYVRIVRDLGRSLSKPVELVVKGEEIRIENTIASVLRNSLVHMIRNSVDHGIEKADTRIAAGKPETGTITLTSQKDATELVVEISDDGGGIDFEKIGSRAVAKGLFTQDEIAKMDENSIGQIMFLPGFSTSKSVSKISGRGVGMDMVKNSVESVGGKIIIESKIGQGSRFRLVFPLENAVMLFL
ncbi:MAG: hypothetical protein CMP10_07830 [Zetaproteobacteria bacterium]|nr:hypothetical protein [Pseudobdellovibrionaceae bacterium]